MHSVKIDMVSSHLQTAFGASEITYEKYGDSFEIGFTSLRDADRDLVLIRQAAKDGTTRAKYSILYHDMDSAGEIIQHMAHSLGTIQDCVVRVRWTTLDWTTLDCSCCMIVGGVCIIAGVTTLSSVSNFASEMKDFQQTLFQVDEYNSIRLKLTTEMADSSGQVKNLVIKAEDARILGEMRLMRKM